MLDASSDRMALPTPSAGSEERTEQAFATDPGSSLWQSLTVLWREKLFWTCAINILFWTGYLFLSRHAFVPVHTLPMTWLDHWAGFRGYSWSVIYESNFLLGVI